MILLSVVMLRQLQRRDPKYFVDLAEAARRQEEWQQAAVFYKQAWQRSQDAEYLVRLGDVLLQDGDVNGALIAWRQALVNQPDLLSAHRTRLDVLMELARTRSDLTAWERVLEAAEAYLQAVGPDRPEDAARARFAMGAGLVQLAAVEEGNRAKGVAELEHAAELAPETVDYALELVRVRVAEGKVDEAERLLDELSKRHASPGRSATLVRLEIARLHAARREIEAAEAAHHEAMRFAEGDPDALRDARLGYAAFLTRRWAVAIRAKDDARASARFDEAESLLRQITTTLTYSSRRSINPPDDRRTPSPCVNSVSPEGSRGRGSTLPGIGWPPSA